jgi:hypothetical protein
VEDYNFTVTKESTTRSEQYQFSGAPPIEGIVHKKFVPPGQTVNGKFYCNILRQFRDNIWCEPPDIWRDNSWALHYDNAPAHRHLLCSSFWLRQILQSSPTFSTHWTLPPVFFLIPEDEIEAQGVML